MMNPELRDKLEAHFKTWCTVNHFERNFRNSVLFMAGASAQQKANSEMVAAEIKHINKILQEKKVD